MVEVVEQLQSSAESPSLEQRLQEATAARRQNQHADILQNLPDGVAVTDVEGKITFANRAIATLLGNEISEGTDIGQWLAANEKSDDFKELARSAAVPRGPVSARSIDPARWPKESCAFHGSPLPTLASRARFGVCVT